MSRYRQLAGVLALWLCGQGAPLLAATALPASPSPHYVLDQANWLNAQEFQSLNAKLEAYERETSSQIVVAIFPSIPTGEELFDYTHRLFESWKPGQLGKDNGVLFCIFAADRKMRIHSGYGMEGVLPDARCQQIISDVVAPQLRQGRRSAAIHAGVDAMIAAAKGEYHGSGSTALKHRPSNSGAIFQLLFALVIVILIIRAILNTKYSSPIGRADRWYGGGYSGGGGGFSSGGGGFSSGGGGFSGGGGRSGGGGASGGW